MTSGWGLGPWGSMGWGASLITTSSGWGLGEWNDMAWGTGVDYPYDPVVFLDAEGVEPAHEAAGARVALGETGARASFAKIGLSQAKLATGVRASFAASGWHPPFPVVTGVYVTADVSSGRVTSLRAAGVQPAWPATGARASLARSGVSPATQQATGTLRSLAGRGSLDAHTATGSVEDE